MLDKMEKLKTPQLYNKLITKIFEIIGLQYFSIENVLKNGVPERLPYLRGIYMIFLMIIYGLLLCLYMFFERQDLEVEMTAKTILTYSIQQALKIGMFIIVFMSLLQSFF